MSAILSVDDLNDFISPGVACIKPIETLPLAPADDSSSQLEHEVILDGQDPQHQQNGTSAANAPAQISLTDCLACSGCVTSAEAVLVSLQSHSELLTVLDSAPSLRVRGPDASRGGYTVEGLEDESRRLFVASVSPQTRASLAAACGGGCTEEQAGRMLDRLLMGKDGLAGGGRWGNRFEWVVDTNAAREACLVLGSDEVLSSPPPSALASPGREDEKKKKPILTSTCPGWVCYAEKTHPYVLPHLSRVKSPQALTGTLLKSTLGRLLGIPAHRIWHLSIMPCFDKKLEASREELTDVAWAAGSSNVSAGAGAATGRKGGVRDVDCVITSKEVFMLTASRGIDFFSLPSSPITPASLQRPFPDQKLHEFLFPTPPDKKPSSSSRSRPARAAGTSGGNLYFILQDVLSRNPESRLETTRGRNADVIEYTVVAPCARGDEAIIFRAARYYGFRNIQNLVRKLKPARPSRMPGGKPFGAAARRPAVGRQVKANGAAGGGGGGASLEHAYVEVMACPGGCTNGGGQVKADDQVIVDRKGYGGAAAKPGPVEQKALLAEVDEAYFSSEETTALPPAPSGSAGDDDGDLVGGISPSRVREILMHWSRLTGVELDRLVYTSFREVVSDVGKVVSDTERVVQLAGKIGGGW